MAVDSNNINWFLEVMSTELFERTEIEGLLIYYPRKFADSRGYFMESYNQKHFQEMGIQQGFVQDNRSFSKKGTLRGLHMQLGDHAQAKLVGVLSGAVFDVAVDLRPGSKTFGQWFGIELNAEDERTKMLYVPRGFAHGFQVISETSEFFYKVDNFYNAASEAGVKHDDKELNIQWHDLDVPKILSEKDEKLPDLKTFIETQ